VELLRENSRLRAEVEANSAAARNTMEQAVRLLCEWLLRGRGGVWGLVFVSRREGRQRGREQTGNSK
jgi:hypothetical protein